MEDRGSKSLRLTEYTRRGRRRCRMAFAGSIALGGLVLFLVVARNAYEAIESTAPLDVAGYADTVEYEESKQARQGHVGTAGGLFRVEQLLVPRPRGGDDSVWVHASSSVAIAHVLLTRFCLRHGSMSHLVAARLSLFRGLSLPTVKSQTASRILWIVLIDETLHDDAVQVREGHQLPPRVHQTTRCRRLLPPPGCGPTPRPNSYVSNHRAPRTHRQRPRPALARRPMPAAMFLMRLCLQWTKSHATTPGAGFHPTNHFSHLLSPMPHMVPSRRISLPCTSPCVKRQCAIYSPTLRTSPSSASPPRALCSESPDP